MVVVGETGSGKTTQIPQYMADMDFTGSGIIGCTQPRQLTTAFAAKRVAEEFGEMSVAYSTGQEGRNSKIRNGGSDFPEIERELGGVWAGHCT